MQGNHVHITLNVVESNLKITTLVTPTEVNQGQHNIYDK
jgi:hypothetical protein